MQTMYSSKEGLIIKPHERREVILKYPTSVIMFHHPSYFKIADDLAKEMTSLVLDKNWKYSKRYRKKYSYKGHDLVLDNPGESARGTMKHAEAHYMWGARHIINIGACGGINPELEIGDHIIGDRAIRDNRVDWELATSDEQAKSDKGVNDSINAAMIGNQLGNYKIERGDVWTVGHKYYQRQRLQHILNDEDYNLHCVEMEMAPLCIMAGWLNTNYGDENDKLRVGNLFYISDLLPHSNDEQWKETMHELSRLVPFKKRVLMWAIESIFIYQTDPQL